MKYLLTILTSHRLDKLKRLLLNVQQLTPVKDIDLNVVIVVNTLNDNYYQEVLKEQFPYVVVRTPSNGKPGRGKNSCAELFLDSDCDFFTQFDGDDFLYPTFLRSLWNHVRHYPSMDVLGIIPCDFVTRGGDPGAGHSFQIKDDLWGSVWGVSMCDSRDPIGNGMGNWLNQELPKSHDYTILQSKKSAKFKIDENIHVGEDHLYTMQLLSQHQKGNLQYFQTMSSDMYAIDRAVDNSIQKQFPQADHVQEMKNKGLQYLDVYRSSFSELPLITKPLLMDQFEKADWIKSNYTREYK